MNKKDKKMRELNDSTACPSGTSAVQGAVWDSFSQQNLVFTACCPPNTLFNPVGSDSGTPNVDSLSPGCFNTSSGSWINPLVTNINGHTCPNGQMVVSVSNTSAEYNYGCMQKGWVISGYDANGNPMACPNKDSPKSKCVTIPAATKSSS